VKTTFICTQFYRVKPALKQLSRRSATHRDTGGRIRFRAARRFMPLPPNQTVARRRG
jgi:hypothetical protein